jgi:uncharacterized repeat protein (TIGR02543 family)
MAKTTCLITGQKGRGGTAYATGSTYVGYDSSSKTPHEYVLRFTTGGYEGESASLTVGIKLYNGGVSGTRTYNYAVLRSDANAMGSSNRYLNTTNAVNDENQIVSGKITLADINKDTVKEFTIPVPGLAPNTQYYLVIWPDGTGWYSLANVRPTDEHSVFVEYTPSATVSFNANGIGVAPGPQTVLIGSALELPSMQAEGYSFYGWAESADASDGIMGQYAPTASVTLYAVWKKVHTVSFDNGGKGDAPSAQTVVDGEAVHLPELMAKGYKFLGWAETQNATDGMTGTYTPSGDVTLYAVWKRKGSVVMVNGDRWYVSYPVDGKLMRCRLAVGTAEGLVYV